LATSQLVVSLTEKQTDSRWECRARDQRHVWSPAHRPSPHLDNTGNINITPPVIKVKVWIL